MPSAVTTLNDRKQKLLELLVSDYIRTSIPVASQQLAQRHLIPVSPATIRNDIAELEELGFISRPHTSAGAVPNDLAYRFFVERIRPNARPARSVRNLLKAAIDPIDDDVDSWARVAAGVLSRTTKNVGITTTPRIFQARLKQLQLIQLQDQQYLIIVIMQEGRLRQHQFTLKENLTHESLTDFSAAVNKTISGLTAKEIEDSRTRTFSTNTIRDQVMNETLRLMKMEERLDFVRLYLEGMGQMLTQPEFLGGRSAQRAVEILEDDQLIKYIKLAEVDSGKIDITIGEEHSHSGLKSFSVILSEYGIPGMISGLICAIGPTRMDYSATIATIRYVAKFLSQLHEMRNGNRT